MVHGFIYPTVLLKNSCEGDVQLFRQKFKFAPSGTLSPCAAKSDVKTLKLKSVSSQAAPKITKKGADQTAPLYVPIPDIRE
jgi:hypothetical protein